MFRFTIRDVLWLTVVVAVALGWWVEHRLSSRTHAAEIKKRDSYSWRHIWAIDEDDEGVTVN